MSVRTRPGLKKKTGIPWSESWSASVSPKRQSAALLAEYDVFLEPGRYAAPDRREDDPSAPALEHARDDARGTRGTRRARSPRARATTPSGSSSHAGVSLSLTDSPAFATRRSIGPSSASVLATHSSTSSRRETSPTRASPSISAATASTCSARPSGDGDRHPGVRELARDRRADPAAAARDERDAFELVRRHGRSPPGTPGSRESTGPRDPAPSACARTARRTIFALRVFGNAETNTIRSGLNDLPSSSVTARETSSGDRLGAWPQHAEEPRHLALHLVRDADRRGLGDSRVVHGGGLELGGADPLARDVQRVVRAAVQEPVAVLVDRGPVAVRPDAREAAPVRLEVALGVPPDPAGHPGPRALADELPDLAAQRAPGVVEDVHVLARAPGSPSEHGFVGAIGVTERKQAPTSVPPEMFTIGIRPAPHTCSSSQSYGPRFHGSPVVVTARSEDRSADGLALRDERADERRRDAEHRHALLLDELPEPVRGPVGSALQVDDRRAERPAARRPSTGP